MELADLYRKVKENYTTKIELVIGLNSLSPLPDQLREFLKEFDAEVNAVNIDHYAELKLQATHKQTGKTAVLSVKAVGYWHEFDKDIPKEFFIQLLNNKPKNYHVP